MFVAKDGEKYVGILGTAIDVINNTCNLDYICSRLADLLVSSKESFLEYVDYLCGRFVIFYYDAVSEGLAVTTDATGMRSVYYSETQDIVASHYGLIQDVAGCTESELYGYYKRMKDRPWILPGNFTPYEGVRGVTANHELLLSSKKLNRIWPRKQSVPVSINVASEKIFEMLTKEVDLVASLYDKIAISLTAGRDSRLSLSLFYNHRDQLTCFAFSSDDAERRKDVTTAESIAKNVGIPFLSLNMVEVDSHSSDYRAFSVICDRNHYHQHMRRGVYLASDVLRDSVHIQSNLVEIIGHRVTFDKLNDKSTYVDISQRLFPGCDDKIILDAFKDYYDSTELGDRKGYHLNDLLYWEYRMCHWLNAACIVESDMAFETIQLMNCRKMLEYGLSCSHIYRKANSFADYIMDKMWPDLMNKAPNTGYTVRDYQFTVSSSIEMSKMNPLVSSQSDNEVYSKVGAVSCDFGFGSSLLKKGDSVNLRMRIPVVRPGIYFVQLCILCPIKCNCSKDTTYTVSYNGSDLYTTDMGSYTDMMNTIDLIVRDGGGKHNLDIRIDADENDSDLVCPCLHIDSVRFKKIEDLKLKSAVVRSSKGSYFMAKIKAGNN